MSEIRNHNQHSLSKPIVQKNNLPRNYHLVPDQFKEVAEGMEKQFARFMIEEMNKTVSHSDTSQAANLYRAWLSDEQAQKIASDSNGIGIKDLILDDIYPRNRRNQIALDAYKQLQNQSNKPSLIRMKESEYNDIDLNQGIEMAINRALNEHGGESHE